MLLLLKFIIGAYFLIWGFRAPDLKAEHFAGPVAVAPAEIALPVEGPRILLKMAADGTLSFEGKAITAGDLGKILAGRVQQDPATGLKIEIAPGVTQDRLFEIVDLAESAGIESIATDPPIDIPPAATFEIGD